MSDHLERSAEAELVRNMFDAVESGDVPRFRSYFEPDAIIWHNTDQREMSLDEICEFMSVICAHSDARSYEDRRIWVAGSAVFIQQAMALELKSGAKMRCPVMVRADISRGGLISRLDEYFDSSATAVLASIPAAPAATFATEH